MNGSAEVTREAEGLRRENTGLVAQRVAARWPRAGWVPVYEGGIPVRMEWRYGQADR